MMALMVCIRFSAWSNTIGAVDSNTSSVTSIPSMPKRLVDLLADLGLAVVERGQAVHELHGWIAGRARSVGVDLVRHQELDPLVPDRLGLAHRDPDVGVEEVDALDALGRRPR